MKTHLVRIGNSQGLRIPKAIVAQCHLDGDLEMEVRDQCLLIRSARAPREGWAQAAATMAECGEDALLDDGLLPRTTWEETEWEW